MSNTAIMAIPAELLDDFWPKVSTYMERAAAVSGGRYEAQDIKDAVRTGEIHLLVALKDGLAIGCLTLRIRQYPRMRVIEGVDIAGEIHAYEDWRQPMSDFVDMIARRVGAEKVEFRGRSGWDRMLQSNGYQKVFAFYEKQVSSCDALSSGTTLPIQ